MTGTNCLGGCTGDSAGGYSQSFNSGVSGERKVSIPESSLPLLPEPIAIPSRILPEKNKTYTGEQWCQDSGLPHDFQAGCYFVRLMPTSLHTPSRFQYEGTLRVQNNGGTIIASGDLYTNDSCKNPTFCPSLSTEGDQNNIPVFPRKKYAYYFRITRVEEKPVQESVLLELQLYRFHRSNNTWGEREPLTAEVSLANGPDGVLYWRGDIMTRSKVVLGNIIVVRISPFLRQAAIEIDRAEECEFPRVEKQFRRWREVFKKAGWSVTINTNEKHFVKEPQDKSWSTAELHQKMLEHREKIDLDRQWHYHLLAVSRFDDRAFGVMYDNTVNGLDDIPREGAAVAFGETFTDDTFWGKYKGQPFGAVSGPYTRTAIHEIGHAMMLYHPDNSYENYIMQKTVHIARNAVPPQEFPHNIQWAFSPRDTHLLCHLPDIAIRPGGVSFGTPHYRLPVNVRDEIIEAEGLELEATPQLEVVPFGAPVRVNFSLINRSDGDKEVPGSLSMKTGHISGRVIDPSGAAQYFATIIHYTRDFRLQKLEAGKRLNHSVTLLWGTQGPLFPTSGFYRVILEVRWDQEGVEVRATGGTGIMVRDPIDDAQACAVLKIFSNPNSLLALAVGGDHIKKKYKAFDGALNHDELKPHYALVEAKRTGQFFKHRPPDLEAAVKIVKADTVMSRAEILRLAKILIYFQEKNKKDAGKKAVKAAIKKLAKILLDKLNKLPKENEDHKTAQSRQKLERLLTIK